MVTVHGLAASIRAAQESETFDLGGMSAESITSVMEAALAMPFPVADMIRITIVTGAGKQARQKYDEGASKCVVTVLQKYGYVEDRGGSCVLSSAGSYKLQHDTGKNRKTVVIFPKINASAKRETGQEEDNLESSPLIPEQSPGYKIAVSSMSVFANMIRTNCYSWTQKKGCLTCIEGLKELLQDLDAKLIEGTALTKSEQIFYDAVAGNLDEKGAHVRELAQTQVDEGNITQAEKELLLQQNAERIASLKRENKSTANALERKQCLESINPVAPHKLKHHAKIAILCKELSPLLRMELDLSKQGRNLLSIKEAAAMTRKDELLQEIERLEDTSREWFEDDSAFWSRVQASRREFQNHPGKKLPTTKSVSGGGSNVAANASRPVATTKWVTPGENIRGGFSALTADKKKVKRPRGNNLFGDMMMDSSDEEEEDEAVKQETVEAAKGEAEDTHTNAVDTSTSEKPKNKKSKKKKKSKQPTSVAANDETDDEFASLDKPDAENAKEGEEDKSTLAKIFCFVQTYVLPILVALLGWLLGLFFGKPKKQKQKRG